MATIPMATRVLIAAPQNTLKRSAVAPCLPAISHAVLLQTVSCLKTLVFSSHSVGQSCLITGLGRRRQAGRKCQVRGLCKVRHGYLCCHPMWWTLPFSTSYRALAMLRSLTLRTRPHISSTEVTRTLEPFSQASGSRQSHRPPSTAPRHDLRQHPMTWSSLRKGKQREGTPIIIRSSGLGRSTQAVGRIFGIQTRGFHSTRPRYAVPLVPAAAAVLKVSTV